MKKLLIGLGIQFGLLCGVQAQTPNVIKAHSVSSTDIIALGLVDSIVHTTDSMQIHLGNSSTNYALNSIDSFSYDSIAINAIPCDFGGYTGAYGSMTDARDGNEYKTVTIGTQTWMAENLRYDVPGVYTYSNSSTDNATDTINPNNLCRSYGRLYDWKTMMNGDTSSSANPSTARGICPSGWHVPSDEEWKTLDKSLGMSQANADQAGSRGTDEGTKMKSINSWSNNKNGSNSFGFNALPAGKYSSYFRYSGDEVSFWSSTRYSTTAIMGRYLSSQYTTVARYYLAPNSGYSCRCVKN